MTPSPSISTASSLIRRLQIRDGDAWGPFVDLYGPLLYSWCRRRGLGEADAADVVQEALLAVFRDIDGYQVQRGSFRGWLWTITVNKVRDLVRRRDPGARGAGGSAIGFLLREFPEVLPEDSTSGSESEQRALVHRALAQVERDVEPQTWEAFRLVVFGGKQPSEAAAELGTTAANVRLAKFRVLRRLRDCLGENSG